jgi:hypothetical protein
MSEMASAEEPFVMVVSAKNEKKEKTSHFTLTYTLPPHQQRSFKQQHYAKILHVSGVESACLLTASFVKASSLLLSDNGKAETLPILALTLPAASSPGSPVTGPGWVSEYTALASNYLPTTGSFALHALQEGLHIRTRPSLMIIVHIVPGSLLSLAPPQQH